MRKLFDRVPPSEAFVHFIAVVQRYGVVKDDWPDGTGPYNPTESAGFDSFEAARDAVSDYVLEAHGGGEAKIIRISTNVWQVVTSEGPTQGFIISVE